MTFVTEKQKDALTEVVNIAFSRSAAALSEITGHRVLLQTPSVSIIPIHELQGALKEFVQGEIATIHQIFSGAVAGDAMLIFNHEGALQLSRLLTEENAISGELYESDREVLTEVGNILLNACLGTFGNILKVQITFAVPRLQLDDLGSLLETLIIGEDEIRFAMVVHTEFHIRDSEISGMLVMVLGVNSLELLLTGLEKLG